MTVMQIEKDGEEYPVLHYRFAINNPNARIYRDDENYYVEINEIHYALGCMGLDGDMGIIGQLIENKILKQTTNPEEESYE